MRRRFFLGFLLALALLSAWSFWRRPNSGSAADRARSPSTVFLTLDAQENAAILERQLQPSDAGWTSEDLAQRVEAKLQSLLHFGKDARLSTVVDKEVEVTPITGQALRERFRDQAVSIRLAESTAQRRRGLEAVVDLLGFLSLGEHPKAKVIGIEKREDHWLADAFVEGNSGAKQFRARWHTTWKMDDAGEPILTKLHWDAHTEAESSTTPWFQDQTASVWESAREAADQLDRGLDHWLTRIERTHGMLYFDRHGLAVGDVNGDGLDDLYVCQGGGLPNRLFVQEGPGKVLEIAREAGVDWLDDTASALFVDLDNDGDQDLVLATFEGVLVLEQYQPLKFERRVLLETSDTDLHGLSSVDVDGDGRLDLYLTVDFADAQRATSAPAFVYHDANDGGRNCLWRNVISDSDWTFIDITASSGLDVHNRRHSLAAAWEDYDNDGDQDLYVGNDYGQNCLYQNNDGRFVEIAVRAGVVDFGSGMSVSWGDVNRDGFMDLYVGNMFSSAGSRLSNMTPFLPGSSPELRDLYQRFSKGNSLFVSKNGTTFEDRSFPSNTAMGRWAWSSLFADFNNDAWEDLVVANGYITTEDTGDL